MLALPPLFTDVQGLVGGDPTAPSTIELLTSALLAVAVVVADHWDEETGRSIRSLRQRGIAHRVVVGPVEVLAHRLAHLDDAVLDRGVEATAGGTVRMARAAALLDDRVIDGAVVWIVSGVRRLGAVVRRPQTGQLHQYYLQSLAVLALVIVVLVLVR